MTVWHLPAQQALTWKVVCTTYGSTFWYSNRRCTKKVCPLANDEAGSTPKARELLVPQTCRQQAEAGQAGTVGRHLRQAAGRGRGRQGGRGQAGRHAARAALPAAGRWAFACQICLLQARAAWCPGQPPSLAGLVAGSLTRRGLSGRRWKGSRPSCATSLKTFWSQACRQQAARAAAAPATHAQQASRRQGRRGRSGSWPSGTLAGHCPPHP